MRPEHIQVIAEAEVARLSRSEMAAKTGLTPRTISRYRRRPEVIEAVEQLRHRPRSERATDVLVGLLGSESEQTRLQAALGILRYGSPQKVQPDSKQSKPDPPAAIVLHVERHEAETLVRDEVPKWAEPREA